MTTKVTTKVTTKEDFEKFLTRACNHLRGHVPVNEYIDWLVPVLYVKAASDQKEAEKAAVKEEYQHLPPEDLDYFVEVAVDALPLKVPEGGDFAALFEAKDSPKIGQKVSRAYMQGVELSDPRLEGVYSTPYNNQERADQIVGGLLTELQELALVLYEGDIFGDLYAFLLRNYGGKNFTGEFYTPHQVAALMAQLIDPVPGDDVCDPTCGTGTLLAQVVRHVKNKQASEVINVYGQDIHTPAAAMAQLHMLLKGFKNYLIQTGDTIGNPKLLDGVDKLRRFDVVVANPPFSLQKWGHEKALKDPFKRFERGVPPKTKGDYAFILHIIETLKDGAGRAAVIVPHGVLFRASTEGKIRRKLIEENLLDAVIGLPEKLFYNTGIPVAILIFRKYKADKSVLFIDASREYRDGKNQNFLEEAHIEKIVKTYANRQSVDKYAYVATPDEIAENDYNLNIPRYVDTFEEEEEIDLMAVRAEREKLKQEMAGLEEEMDGYLKELGF